MTRAPAISTGLLAITVAACSLLAPFAIKTAPAPSDLCMGALGQGILARNSESGIGLIDTDGRPVSVTWPFGYSGSIELGRAVLADDEGKVLAREGDEVTLGGGYGPGDLTFTACGDVTVVKLPDRRAGQGSGNRQRVAVGMSRQARTDSGAIRHALPWSQRSGSGS